jgi:predicted alpha/beta-fold hydrolase
MLIKSDKVRKEDVMAVTTLRQFDEAGTRRIFGYASLHDYYFDASSSRKIENVKVPLLCLNALDDPIAHHECLPVKEVEANPNVVLATTPYGGKFSKAVSCMCLI